MEIRQVRYFMEVAAGGSFNQAAARLHLTQPAVSRQIKALEEELGVVLLARGKRSVALTQEGEIFMRRRKTSWHISIASFGEYKVINPARF